MGDKIANVLIIFMMVIILGLGGIYYAKIVGSYNHETDENPNYSGLVENESNDNLNTINDTSEENRLVIAGVEEGSDIYNKNLKSGYKYNNRYYYNSLNEEGKIIYDVIVNNIDKLKNGNERINVDYDFNKLLTNANGQEALKRYYEDAINAINLDVPNLFYLDFSKMWITIEKTSSLFGTKFKVYIDQGKDNQNYLVNGFTSGAQVEIAVSQVEMAKNQVKTTLIGSDYDKVKSLHDWLIEYMEYDSGASNKSSVYGALIEKRGVCESYSRTFKYILDELGIENILATGTATNSNGRTEDHMWNYVKLNGKWYAVDPTWDDPIIIGGGIPSNEVKHRYFLKGSGDFFKNHTEKLTISSSERIFMLPRLETSNY